MITVEALPYIIALPRELQAHYCVYTLVDASNGEVFYVGKGCASRFQAHTTESRFCHCLKCVTIRKIWKSGSYVQVAILFETDNERDAYAYEWGMINMVFASSLLTNIKDNPLAIERKRESCIQRHPESIKTPKKTLQKMEESLSLASYHRAVSLAEVSSRLGISPRALKRMIEDKRIGAFKVMGQWRIRQSEMDRLCSDENS